MTGILRRWCWIDKGERRLITETTDAENSRIKRKNIENVVRIPPRNYSLHTMKTLPQFRNKSHVEVRQYIIEKKGVDIGSNFRWNNTMVWILVALVAVTGEIEIVK